jgi:hypothetical protein
MVKDWICSLRPRLANFHPADAHEYCRPSPCQTPDWNPEEHNTSLKKKMKMFSVDQKNAKFPECKLKESARINPRLRLENHAL